MRKLAMTTLLAGLAAGLGIVGNATPSVAQEDKVLARVGGTEIRSSDVEFAGRLYGPVDSAVPPEAKQSTLVDALIDLKVMSDAAIAAGIEKDPAYQRQVSLLRQQALRAAYLERMVTTAVTDDIVRKTYDEQVAKIPPVEEVRVRQIFIDTEADAAAAIAALKAGEDFGAVAKRASKDELSREQGGDLGFSTLDQLLPEVSAAIKEMEVGETSPSPIKSSFGYHVVKLEQKRTRPAPAFESVSAQIRSSLEAAAAQKIAAELRSKASVEKLIPDVAMPADDGHQHGPDEGK